MLLIILLLATIQAVLSLFDFFSETDTLPPRILAAVAPAIILILWMFISNRGKTLLDGFNIRTYTYLHSIRIAVEIVIFYLFIYGLMPKSMTFEGRNFDIISGLTAPIIGFLAFRNQKFLNKPLLLLWNIVCLALVLQVVTTGILSVPSQIQVLSFDQPNRAVLYFPFIWLPGIVVPIVIFGHLVAIRQITMGKLTSQLTQA